MPRKNNLTKTRALSAATMHEVLRLKKANLLQGSQWKVNCDTSKQEINDLESIQIEAKITSGDYCKEKSDEFSSATRCQTPVDEELWVVRRQLCRGCHSDGAFWSLQTTTEGDTYGDLLKTYFNIQLCPVSKDELALSAICALCAERLREARAFSAQARAAEERFTRLYKQNRVRAPVNDSEIKKDVPNKKNEVNDFEITDDIEPDTASSNLDNPKSTIDELTPTLNKNEKTQDRHRTLFRLLPSDYERVGNLFKCTRCNKLYNRGMINKHVKHTHLKIPKHKFTCTHCEKIFHHVGPFTKHKLKEHSIDDRIKCNACDWFTYHTKAELKKHKNEIHMLGEKLTCPDCDYVSFSRTNLRKHAVRHSTEKKHICKYCKKSFLRKSSLTEHEKIHTDDKRRVCNVCGRTFVQRASLTYHMTKHHPEVRF